MGRLAEHARLNNYVKRVSPQCLPGETPGGQAKTALPVWWMYSLSASAARARWSRMNWSGSLFPDVLP